METINDGLNGSILNNGAYSWLCLCPANRTDPDKEAEHKNQNISPLIGGDEYLFVSVV